MATAYYYCTGPVDVYIRIPKIGAGPYYGPKQLLADPTVPTFLGHCEKTPKPSHEQKYKPVFSSQSGEVIPADKVYQGQDVKIALPLSRFDYDAVQLLLASPRFGRLTPPGTESYIDRGTLLQRNGLGVELWLRNSFWGTINQAAYPNLPIGMYFISINPVATVPDNLTRDTMNVQLLLEANWVGAWPAGNFLCFSQDPAYFKRLPQIG